MLPIPDRIRRRNADDDVVRNQRENPVRVPVSDDSEDKKTKQATITRRTPHSDGEGWLRAPESRRESNNKVANVTRRNPVIKLQPHNDDIASKPYEDYDDRMLEKASTNDTKSDLPHDDSFDFGSDAIELVDDTEDDEPEEPPIMFNPADASLPVDTIPENDAGIDDSEPEDDGDDDDNGYGDDVDDGDDLGIDENEGDGWPPDEYSGEETPQDDEATGDVSDETGYEPDETISAQGMSSQSPPDHNNDDTSSQINDKGKRSGLFARLKENLPDMSGIGARLRSEIGSKDDSPKDSGLNEEAKPVNNAISPDADDALERERNGERAGGHSKRHRRGNPFGRLIGAYRKVSRIRRRIYVITGILACLVGVWTVPNLHAAFNPSSSSFESNEGTVKVSDPSYGDGHVSFKATNDSEMIAHISVKAEVKAWSPVPRWPTSLFAPRTIMGCGETSAEINPGESKTITMECHGGNGIWKRPAIEVISG